MTKLVALIVEDDKVFALPAWHRTIGLLERRGFLVTHVAVIPSRLDQYDGVLRKLWYLSVFGVGNALRMRLFKALEKARRNSEPRTWEEMAHTHALIVRRFEDPNGADIQVFLRTSQCDVLHVWAPMTLSPAIAGIPRSGAIAHHASMLPSGRGLYPYFWARLHGDPIGQSFQQVSPGEPFAGPLLAQSEAHGRAGRSMLAFQVWSAQRYPEMALDATQRLLSKRSLPQRAGVEASYRSLPTRRERLDFQARGGRISTWADLRLTLSIRHRLTTLPAAGDADETADKKTYKFPEVLPFRANESADPGKVIPMQPRRQAQG